VLFRSHAAHAAIYPWLAVIVAARARLTVRPATIALVVGFAIALVVGLTRVYLRVHFLTDVLGGWGLGAAAFAGSAAVVMLVGRLAASHPKWRSQITAGRRPRSPE